MAPEGRARGQCWRRCQEQERGREGQRGSGMMPSGAAWQEPWARCRATSRMMRVEQAMPVVKDDRKVTSLGCFGFSSTRRRGANGRKLPRIFC